VVNADSTVYDTAAVAERPTAHLISPLTYPPEAEHKHIQGRVLVGATVNSDGTIEQTSVTVLHSVHPLLDAEAERFVKAATLWPACRNGQPVRVRIAVPVVFDAGPKVPNMEQSFLIGLGVGLGLMLVGLASGN
jgi:TonB family protein